MSVCADKIYQQIHREWNQAIQRFIQSRGVNYSDAADLCQDCFVKLWNKCQEVQPERAGAFLFQVAKNLSIDHFRRGQTRLKHRGSIKSQIVLEDGQYQLEIDEFKTRLEAAIESMSPASREVFVMHRFDDKSYREMSELLGISIKAVEKRMHKALLHLSQKNILKGR